MPTDDMGEFFEAARRGTDKYLDDARKSGRIDAQSYRQAKQNVMPNLGAWLKDDYLPKVSPNLRAGICEAISAEKWEEIVNAFRQSCRFGTGGIRGMMAFDYASIKRLKEEGLTAPILKGPNTINDIVLLRTSAGVAQFGREQNPPLTKMAIGYDSRIRGQDFAELVAQLFLAYGYTVYFFDEPCPYPEVTFAVPYEKVKADIGILISASHNDYRYNGYKLTCGNGSQFDPQQREEMYNDYIAKATSEDIKLCPFPDAPAGKLVFLGGREPLPGFDYCAREDSIVNIHRQHANHVKSFVLTDDLAQRQQKAAEPLKIAYCAFHGAGRRAVPRLLDDLGFRDLKIITEGGLNDLDGLFPSFRSDPGEEQQPDPGDPRAACTALSAFAKQYGASEEFDILIGTDPDADRCGVVVKVPPEQQHLYDENHWGHLYGEEYRKHFQPHRKWLLLPADQMWALVLWYRLAREVEKYGTVKDAEKQFIVLSHTTSDSIVRVARKHGLGVIKTWVGFAALAAGVRDVWEGKGFRPLSEGRESSSDPFCDPFICEFQDMDNGQRSINVGAYEQSNGFSILGGPPPDDRSLGVGGHVRDKDGTFAALLIAEIAAWAKEQGTTIYELVDQHIHCDPDVGLFVNHYEPDPMDGEYPGIEGDRKKKGILRRALGHFQLARAGDLEIGGHQVTSAVIYRTGKYDKIYPPTYDFEFPDEGIRFYFGNERNHATIRPSGTGNAMRLHIQLHEPDPRADLVGKKQELRDRSLAIADHLRELLKAPRS